MCEHHLIRATIIPEVAKLIAERFGISEDEALGRFYRSATAKNLADEETGLYGQSALFIFSQYLEEAAMAENADSSGCLANGQHGRSGGLRRNEGFEMTPAPRRQPPLDLPPGPAKRPPEPSPANAARNWRSRSNPPASSFRSSTGIPRRPSA